MADEKNLQAEEVAEAEVTADKAPKAEKNKGEKKENFFIRFGKKIKKLCRDLVSEMKKVVWTPKAELAKSTKLVIFTVIAIGLAIAFIDTTFSYLINTIAGLVG